MPVIRNCKLTKSADLSYNFCFICHFSLKNLLTAHISNIKTMLIKEELGGKVQYI